MLLDDLNTKPTEKNAPKIYTSVCAACGNQDTTANYWLASYRCTHCGTLNAFKHVDV